MKKHEKFAAPRIKRLIAVIALAVIIISAFSGCASPKQSTLSVSVSDISHDETNSLSEAQLKQVAELLASNPSAREAFVAAYRGYDMTQKDFDLTVERPALSPSPEYAVNVINKFDTEKKLAAFDYTVINEADMLSVVNSLKSTVSIDEKRGFVDSIQYGIGVVLSAITNTVGFGHYIIGICLFAIIIEIFMLPFGIKQQKNSIRQAMLRPKEMAIRKKYAGRNDQPTQQKVATEIQELYQKEGFNPMGGCLPLLIQFPIIIILYNIVVDPIRYVLGLSADISAAISTFCGTAKAAGGLGYAINGSRGTIEALSIIKENGGAALDGIKEFLYIGNNTECFEAIDAIAGKIPSFNIGPLNCGFIPSFQNWLWIIPVLTFFVYFGSMKLTRKLTFQPQTAATTQQQGCSNNIMDITMPLMSVYIAFITPAAIGIYWMFRSVLNTVKQFILSRVMPLPQFTEEDYKKAEKEMKASAKGMPTQRNYVNTTGTKPRSLHHIDDEDYETQVPAPQKKKSEAREDSRSTSVEIAPLKDDKKDEEKPKQDEGSDTKESND